MDFNITTESYNITMNMTTENITSDTDNSTKTNDEIEDIKNETRRSVNYIGHDITKREDIVTIGTGSATVGIIFLFFLIYLFRKRQNIKELKNYIALQHLLSGLVREICVCYYNLDPSCGEAEVTSATYSCLDLLIPLFTLCLSSIVFLKLFFFPYGEPLYNKKEISTFSTISVAILQLSEECFGVLNWHNDMDLAGALRLTSVLFIMSVPIVIFFLIFSTLCFKSSEVPKQQAVFYVAHLFVFISSDIVFLLSNFDVDFSYNIFQILLYVRLVVEMLWFVICNSYIHL